jgi:hypothetical protein
MRPEPHKICVARAPNSLMFQGHSGVLGIGDCLSDGGGLSAKTRDDFPVSGSWGEPSAARLLPEQIDAGECLGYGGWAAGKFGLRHHPNKPYCH